MSIRPLKGDYPPTPQPKTTSPPNAPTALATGTLVVCDVDVRSHAVRKVYRANEPEHPAIYRHPENAKADRCSWLAHAGG